MNKADKLAHDALEAHAAQASTELCQMMQDGSREYRRMRELLTMYSAYHHAADVISGQIGETNFGDLPA